MLIRNLLLGLSGALILSSCGDSIDEKLVHPNTKDATSVIQYSPEEIKLQWTAYKFNVKAPVAGTFNEIKVEGYQRAGNITDLMEGFSFEMPVVGINSKNPERDAKLQKNFFGHLANSSIVKGEVTSVKENGNIGEIEFAITLNDTTVNRSFSYQMNNESIVVNGSINILDWNGMAAIEGLNEVCGALHTGSDGVMKFWEFFDIKIEVPFKKVNN